MTRVGRSDGGAANHRERAMASRPMIGTTSSAITADWRDILALTNLRVMTPVVFTGLCGLVAAPVMIHPALAFTAILCLALAAGAAGAHNNRCEEARTIIRLALSHSCASTQPDSATTN